MREEGPPTSHAADLARYYDLDLLTDPGDLPFYLDLAASSAGPILELAAGSGRVAIPLAAAGHDVTGVDRDAAMLDRARAGWQRTAQAGRSDAGSGAGNGTGSLTLIEHDLLTLRLPTRFDLVILALNSVLLLDGRAAQERALEVMRAHLAPEGRAIIDVWLPTREDLALYDGRQVLDWIRTDPETSERVAKTTVARYDARAHTAQLTTTYDVQGEGRTAHSVTRHDTISFIGKTELVATVQRAGLRPEAVLGDYAGTVWSEASERVVLIARAE